MLLVVEEKRYKVTRFRARRVVECVQVAADADEARRAVAERIGETPWDRWTMEPIPATTDTTKEETDHAFHDRS